MNLSTQCPHCGQQSPNVRLGVRLSKRKVHLFDLISRAGSAGIDGEYLWHAVFGSNGSRQTMRAHICQINEILEETDFRLRATRGPGSRYRLIKLKVREFNI